MLLTPPGRGPVRDNRMKTSNRIHRNGGKKTSAPQVRIAANQSVIKREFHRLPVPLPLALKFIDDPAFRAALRNLSSKEQLIELAEYYRTAVLPCILLGVCFQTSPSREQAISMGNPAYRKALFEIYSKWINKLHFVHDLVSGRTPQSQDSAYARN